MTDSAREARGHVRTVRDKSMMAIVGGGAAGLSAACALREFGYLGSITVFASETSLPYERPALSKGFLADELEVPLPIRSAAVLADLGIAVELGAEVIDVDVSARTLATVQEGSVRYDRLLLATGAEPRRLDLPHRDAANVHSVRELEGARVLRRALRTASRVVVIGGGVIGLEVAASAVRMGAAVTVVEAAPHLMGRVVPARFGRLLARLHEDRGVAIATNTQPIALDCVGDQVRGVMLDDGRALAADLVIVGVGVIPRTTLAVRAGLKIDDGIVVDEYFRASEDRIFAAGDVASVFHAGLDGRLRTEHWQAAQDQGRLAAASMLGKPEAYRAAPWMWSDQHELHIQCTGYGFSGTTIVERGDIGARTGVTYFGVAAGRLVAACGVSTGTGVSRTIRAAQLIIDRGVPVGLEQLGDSQLDLRRLATKKAA